MGIITLRFAGLKKLPQNQYSYCCKCIYVLPRKGNLMTPICCVRCAPQHHDPPAANTRKRLFTHYIMAAFLPPPSHRLPSGMAAPTTARCVDGATACVHPHDLLACGEHDHRGDEGLLVQDALLLCPLSHQRVHHRPYRGDPQLPRGEARAQASHSKLCCCCSVLYQYQHCMIVGVVKMIVSIEVATAAYAGSRTKEAVFYS